jgi:hypothetical protein
VSRVPWSPEEEDILKKLATRGCVVTEIQAVLKSRSFDAINNKAHKMGLSLGGRKPEIDQAAFQQLMKRR